MSIDCAAYLLRLEVSMTALCERLCQDKELLKGQVHGGTARDVGDTAQHVVTPQLGDGKDDVERIKKHE